MPFNGVRGSEDRISVKIAGEEAVQLEQYEIKVSVLTQPASFAFHLGTGDAVAKLIAKYPPNTKVQLFVNDVVYATGFTDGYATSGAPGMLTLKGRDVLKRLQQGFVPNEFSVQNVTYKQLVRKILDEAGLKDAALAATNRANRIAITSSKPNELQPPRNVDEEQVETENGGVVKRSVQAHLGETWHSFAKRHLDRAGLFLWAAGDGSFVLSEPNPNQDPLYRLDRVYPPSVLDPVSFASSRRSADIVGAFSNIVDSSHDNDTTNRYAKVAVYARGGGRKSGRTKATAIVEDDEMVAWGFTEELALRDVNADTPKKAEFWARKKIAESRRGGWRLSYTVQGHTTTALVGGKATWAPDTMVLVNDDKLGFSRAFYLEGVTFKSSPETTTVLDLLRPDDLVFGDEPPPGLEGATDLAI